MRWLPWAAILVLLHSLSLFATEKERHEPVHSIAALQQAVSRARPGDVIELKNGQYDQACTLAAKGTPDRPIVIRAQTLGEAHIRNRVTLGGEYVTLMGIRFSGMGSVQIKGRGCRLSRCHMSNVRIGNWVRVDADSRNIEIDHCLFENKQINLKQKRGCQLLQLRVRNKKERHHIHHNHFRDIPKGGSGNGFETLQLITQGNPFDPPEGHSETRIEDNLFERCNGEPEIISVKSNGNLIRRNTFRACNGSVVLRHGDANVASANIFLGDGEPGSGGIRLQGTDQVVVNNYFQGLGRYAVAMTDGTPDDLYMRVERAHIVHNTVVDCNYALKVGLNHSKHPNGTVPRKCVIANNIFLNRAAADADAEKEPQIVMLVQDDKPEAWSWTGNIYIGKLGMPPLDGIREEEPHLRFQKDGVAWPTVKTPTMKGPPGDLKAAEHDLFGLARGDQVTPGAVQFSKKDPTLGPLSERQVGPRAPEHPNR